MTSKYDKREMEYLDFRLNKWIQDNPDKDLKEEFKMSILAEKDLEAIENNSFYIQYIDTEIPYLEVNIMVDLMERIKKCKGTKYAMYRASEDYLKRTAWYQKLDAHKRYAINFDFYNTIILGIHDCFGRREWYKKRAKKIRESK